MFAIYFFLLFQVNHFPGSGFITNKGSLATLQLEAFPKAFRIPKDKEKLLKFVRFQVQYFC